MRGDRRWPAALGCAALAVIAAACAIPTQGSPSTMPRSKVPFNLLNPHLPTTTTTLPKLSSLVEVTVYLLNSALQLSPVQRVVPVSAPLSDIVNSMLAGPTSTEAAEGTVTAIPNGVRVLSISQPLKVQNAVVTVNMNTEFGLITGNDTELAVAQIVATIAAQSVAGTGVVFEIDGVRTSVPVSNGQYVAGPVYLSNFGVTAAP